MQVNDLIERFINNYAKKAYDYFEPAPVKIDFTRQRSFSDT